ncbi:17-beta-hydroxysteroid dehydrogenase type 3-like [Centruroides vittatus]|uniref:17-beta-hydroxysteroid dehydrogenase type 3-like n=1 Tax=Centruroides vittatus TaxID=120091 RepID=UPI00350F44C8
MVKLYVLPKFIKQDLKKYGEWAVITGGSSGIGKHTAIELAKFGLKLILISNELEQLQETAKDIETNFGLECCYVLADLTGGKEVYDYLWSKIEGKDVGIFVNCTGIAGRAPCYFLDETESNTLVEIALNAETVVNITYRMSNLYAKKKNTRESHWKVDAALPPLSMTAHHCIIYRTKRKIVGALHAVRRESGRFKQPEKTTYTGNDEKWSVGALHAVRRESGRFKQPEKTTYTGNDEKLECRSASCGPAANW